MSLGEYIYLRLLGTTAAGTSTAAWPGLLDRHTGTWDSELLAAARIEPDQLSRDPPPDMPMTDLPSTLADDVSSRWPALAKAAWFAPVSDGYASNVGVGAVDEATMAATLATSGAIRVLVSADPAVVRSGLWCYRVARSHWLIRRGGQRRGPCRRVAAVRPGRPSGALPGEPTQWRSRLPDEADVPHGVARAVCRGHAPWMGGLPP
ncbi:MAG: hypothetical protein WCG47_24580 [Dermatophilaceae bacterium]